MRRFIFGLLKSLKGTAPNFLEPLSEEELSLWEAGGDDLRDSPQPLLPHQLTFRMTPTHLLGRW